MSALCLMEKHTRRPMCNLMLPSAAARPGSPAPLNEPLCGCSPLGTAPSSSSWHSPAGTFWQVLASFNTSVSASSKFTLAPHTCRWHGCQLPSCKNSLLLPRPSFQSFACSALCSMPQILVGGLCICQGTGKQWGTANASGPFPLQTSRFCSCGTAEGSDTDYCEIKYPNTLTLQREMTVCNTKGTTPQTGWFK